MNITLMFTYGSHSRVVPNGAVPRGSGTLAIIGFVVVLLFVVAVFLSSDSERGLGARQSEKPRSYGFAPET